MSFQNIRLPRALFPAVFLASAGAVLPAFAQDPDAEYTEVDELVVNATRTSFGQVVGDIAPEVTLSPREIRAYGAANVSELIEALAPQTNSGQGSGRPVTLINGGRISGYAEVRDLPTEAIARVEILPEEVSLKYGYPAEQKVLNIVLRRRFRATLLEGSASTPTQSGGGGTLAGHGGRLRIREGTRLMLDAKATRTGAILESDRDVIGGEGEFRSLQPRSSGVTLNAVLARPLGDGVSGTVNGAFETTDSESRLGLSPFSSTALKRKSSAEDARIAAAAAGALAGWQWSYTGEISRIETRSTTQRSFGTSLFDDLATSRSTSAQSDMVLNKALWRLPAGQLGAAFTARVSATELESDATRLGAAQSSDVSRSIGQLGMNLDIPLVRADQGLGKLSANANLNAQRLSDFGGLETVGGGLNWTPVTPVRILVSYSRTDQAPTINQLGDPVSVTPGVRVFDLATGETAEVTRITGGSRDLDAGRRDVLKLGVTYKPFEKTNLTFQANFVSSRTHDAIVAFPSASTQVEAAFPERFTRDAAGALLQIDARPVNFARQSRDELRWGFTFSRPVGPTPTPDQIATMRRNAQQARANAESGQAARQADQRGAAPRGDAPQGETPAPRPPEGQGGQGRRNWDGGPPGGGRGRGGPGGFGGFGGPRGGGVFQVGLYHTAAFKDEVLIRPGLPALDLLDGGAIGAGGGSPRHQVDLQTNYSRRGLGAAMNASWQSATRINGGADGDLRFSDFTTVNLRLFADLGMQPWARKHTWLRGARATLSINNLFDERQQVRTASGTIPINYQPDLLDPVGRSVKLTLRKLIF